MRESALQVDSANACKNTGPCPDGAYSCLVHYFKGSGIQRRRVDLGNDNPLAGRNALKRLIPVLSTRLGNEYKHSTDRGVVLEQFLGLSVVRFCVRNGHNQKEMPELPDIPRIERVKTIAFTEQPGNIIPVRFRADQNKQKLDSTGVGSVFRLDVSPAAIANNVIVLPTAPDDRGYSSSSAVFGPASKGQLKDRLILLHQYVQTEQEQDEGATPRFIEEIVDIQTLVA